MPRVIVRGFDRPNIWLGVERYEDEPAKLRALIERVGEAERPGIVYAATRRTRRRWRRRCASAAWSRRTTMPG